MSKRFHFWCMIINGAFVLTNGFFMMILEKPTTSFIAAFICLIAFCNSFSNYINSEQ